MSVTIRESLAGNSWRLRTQTNGDPAGGTFEVEDLAAVLGQTIVLRRRYRSGSGLSWYWHLDTVRLEAFITSPRGTVGAEVCADGFGSGDTGNWSAAMP